MNVVVQEAEGEEKIFTPASWLLRIRFCVKKRLPFLDHDPAPAIAANLIAFQDWTGGVHFDSGKRIGHNGIAENFGLGKRLADPQAGLIVGNFVILDQGEEERQVIPVKAPRMRA